MSDYLIPLITFITGVGGTKLIDRVFGWKTQKLTFDQDDKKILWTEFGKLQEKVEKLSQQVDYWQQKYMDLLTEYSQNKAMYEQLLQNYNRVMEELETLKAKFNF